MQQKQAMSKAIVLLILSFLAGCVMMSSTPAEVKLHSLEFVKANPFEQRFILSINIRNTSSKSLFVRTLHYKIMINGIPISSDEQFIWREIPAFSTQQVDILISANIWAQLKPLVRTIKDYGEINYYLSGKIITGSLFYQKVSYINHSGTLTPDQLPKDKIDRLRKKLPYTVKP